MTNYDRILEEGNSMFVVIEKTELWDIVYHRETKVMYAVSKGMHNHGNFTVLYNSNGTPMTYSKEDKQ